MILSPAHTHLILSGFAPGARILAAVPMQQKQPCPLRVTVYVPETDGTRQVVLRLSGNDGGVEREASVLPALLSLGLPVPELLSPALSGGAGFAASVISFLPGRTLQALTDENEANIPSAISLASDAIVRLFRQTEALSRHAVAETLPRRTLWDEWRTSSEAGAAWCKVGEFRETLAHLKVPCAIAAGETSLVFSNGDYQPGNFLTDGETVTGYLDFEKAGFEDPLWTLARYPVYDLKPFQHHGLTDAVLIRLGFTQQSFALRVVLFGLRTLRTKTNPETGHNAALSERVWTLIRRSIAEMKTA